MQASHQHHRRQTAPSIHQNPVPRLQVSHQLVLQLRHHPMPALLPDQGSRSLNLASSHVPARRRKVPSGSVHCAVPDSTVNLYTEDALSIWPSCHLALSAASIFNFSVILQWLIWYSMWCQCYSSLIAFMFIICFKILMMKMVMALIH